jgi:hypothetical protein
MDNKQQTMLMLVFQTISRKIQKSEKIGLAFGGSVTGAYR